MDTILVVNAGSSSVKFGVFAVDASTAVSESVADVLAATEAELVIPDHVPEMPH
jgi:acetate kinase